MKTVLIVDDELDIIEALKSILEDEHYKVVSCGNGREALKCLGQAKPDLAIIDIMMPVMNGYETIKSIRKHPDMRGVPILVMSAIYPTVQAEEHKWDGFLKKPFSLRDLLDNVHRLAPPEPGPEE